MEIPNTSKTLSVTPSDAGPAYRARKLLPRSHCGCCVDHKTFLASSLQRNPTQYTAPSGPSHSTGADPLISVTNTPLSASTGRCYPRNLALGGFRTASWSGGLGERLFVLLGLGNGLTGNGFFSGELFNVSERRSIAGRTGVRNKRGDSGENFVLVAQLAHISHLRSHALVVVSMGRNDGLRPVGVLNLFPGINYFWEFIPMILN